MANYPRRTILTWPRFSGIPSLNELSELATSFLRIHPWSNLGIAHPPPVGVFIPEVRIAHPLEVDTASIGDDKTGRERGGRRSAPRRGGRIAGRRSESDQSCQGDDDDNDVVPPPPRVWRTQRADCVQVNRSNGPPIPSSSSPRGGNDIPSPPADPFRRGHDDGRQTTTTTTTMARRPGGAADSRSILSRGIPVSRIDHVVRHVHHSHDYLFVPCHAMLRQDRRPRFPRRRRRRWRWRRRRRRRLGRHDVPIVVEDDDVSRRR